MKTADNRTISSNLNYLHNGTGRLFGSPSSSVRPGILISDDNIDNDIDYDLYQRTCQHSAISYIQSMYAMLLFPALTINGFDNEPRQLDRIALSHESWMITVCIEWLLRCEFISNSGMTIETAAAYIKSWSGMEIYFGAVVAALIVLDLPFSRSIDDITGSARAYVSVRIFAEL